MAKMQKRLLKNWKRTRERKREGRRERKINDPVVRTLSQLYPRPGRTRALKYNVDPHH